MSYKVDKSEHVAPSTCKCCDNELSYNHETNAVTHHPAPDGVCCCMTDEDYERYQALIAAAKKEKEAAEAAKADFFAKSALLNLLALQGNNPAATNSAILNTLQNLDLSSITVELNNAKTALQGDDITATNTALKGLLTNLASAIAAIPSVSGYATETNATANKEEVLAKVQEYIDYFFTKFASYPTTPCIKASMSGQTRELYPIRTTVINSNGLKAFYYRLPGDTSEYYIKAYSEWEIQANSPIYRDPAYNGGMPISYVSEVLKKPFVELKGIIGSASDAATASTVFGKLAAILGAFGNINFSTLKSDLQGNDTTATLTAIMAALQSSEEETPEELPAGLADRVLLLLQHFGIAGSYEAEAKGGERTNNTVIDECKVRFQEAFNGLLPTGFTMPNSVTVDNLTYTGTTNS